MRALVSILVLLALAVPARAELVRLPTRPGVTLPLAIEAPRGQATAWALIFAGGEGALSLDASGQPTQLRGNFLIRARQHLSSAGIGLVLVDAPSDRSGGLRGFRHTAEHAADIAAAVTEIRRRFGRPVWLIGTSAGTVSVAHALPRLTGPARPDGVVQTASITRTSRNNAYSALQAPIGGYTGAVYVASHQDDACQITPSADTPQLLAAFSGARPNAMRIFTGGLPPRSDPCQAMSAHGFLGIEAEVMAAIAAFVRAPR